MGDSEWDHYTGAGSLADDDAPGGIHDQIFRYMKVQDDFVREVTQAGTTTRLRTPTKEQWAQAPSRANPRPPRLTAIRGTDLAEFYAYMHQSEYWIMWDAERRLLSLVSVQDMSREHAKNAAKWLMKNRQMLKRRYAVAVGVQGTPWCGINRAKEIVANFPLYNALRHRMEIPPGQQFTRKELRYLAADYSPENLTADDDGFEENLPLEREIFTKAILYVEGDI